jgi:dihydroneopterin aldolase
MMKVSVHKYVLQAAHGVFAEEQLAGNEFEVSLDVYYEEPGYIERLEDTVNYAELAAIIRDRMSRPSQLLETVAMDIVAAVKVAWPRITEINITIDKLHPPIPNFQGRVGVSFIKKFDP